jgi:hypothetical protein
MAPYSLGGRESEFSIAEPALNPATGEDQNGYKACIEEYRPRGDRKSEAHSELTRLESGTILAQWQLC